MITLICQECGKEYYRRPSAAIHSHFCSNTCRACESGRKFVKNLIGKRFGRLTVIERVSDGKHGETRWLCQCDCGNTANVYGNSLTTNKTKSCGCLREEVSKTQASINFSKPIAAGQRFGRLTVEYEAGRKGGLITYSCLCDCGNRVMVRSADLRSGNTKSCGCYNIDQIKKRTTTHGLSRKPHFSRWRHQVRRDIDKEWIIEMNDALLRLQPACVVCGSTENLSVDHVRPVSKGFGLKPGNAIILCGSCNSRKHDKDLQDLPPDWHVKIECAAREFAKVWEERAAK